MTDYEHDGMSNTELSGYLEEVGYDSEDAKSHVSNFRKINRYLPLAIYLMSALSAIGLFEGLISGKRSSKSICALFIPCAFYCAYKIDKINLRFEDIIETVRANRLYKNGKSSYIAPWVKPLDEIKL